MFSTAIDFAKRIRQNLLRRLHTPVRLARIEVMVKPFKVMYNEFVALKAEYLYKVRTNGAIVYLETALNDRFDNTLRRIYIADATYPKVYIYRLSELKPAIVLYKRWNGGTYAVGEFAVQNNIVYQCTTGHTNKIPGVDPEWTATARTIPVLRKAANYNGAIAFFVMVPAALVFSADEMNSLIKYYKLAGPGYLIKTF